MSDPNVAQVVVWIYALKDPRNGETRYVGKSTNPKKRLGRHLFDAGNAPKTHLHSWIRGLLKEGLLPAVERLEKTNAEEWEEAERRWIADLRSQGVRLTNHSDGGEGNRGAIFSEEVRAKLSAISKGKPKSPEHAAKLRENLKKATEASRSPESREKMRQAKLGTHASEETRAKQSAARKGRTMPPFSEEHRRKIAEANLGKHLSEEAKRKIGDAHRGKPKPESFRVKISEALRGRPVSEETRAKMRASNLGKKHAPDAGTRQGDLFLVSHEEGPWIPIHNLTQFALDNDLNRAMLYRVLRGQQDSYKGWRIRRPDPPLKD